jgi:deazaflavin-dependent oxidoreductase (nitroreductase family)
VAPTDSDDSEVVAAFRAGSGRIGGDVQGQALLLLHDRGAKSGVERVTPLLYWKVNDSSVAVLATNYGAPRHPAWYHNLRANPATTVEIGAAPRPVLAREATPGERSELLDRMKTTPGVSAAIGRTARQLPVIVLDGVATDDPDDRRAHS